MLFCVHIYPLLRKPSTSEGYFDMSYGVVGLPSPLYSNGLLPSTNKQVNVHPEKNDLYKNP